MMGMQPLTLRDLKIMGFTVCVLQCVMKALKCKTLGTEFATEVVVGNGRRMSRSQIYVL